MAEHYREGENGSSTARSTRLSHEDKDFDQRMDQERFKKHDAATLNSRNVAAFADEKYDDHYQANKSDGLPVDSRETGPEIVATEDYSVFTVPQKRAIVLAGSYLSWFSPMTGAIYYPALDQIAGDLNVSSSKVNITVTTYLILQGLAPMMIAGFSDKAGRRPAYFICFIIYIIANLALALQDNYVALLILRMVQSAGSSGTVALAQGLVGDIVVSSERGKYVAYASLGSLLGPTVSPVFGGLLSEYLGWHWIFWFLLILSVASFIPLILFLPETCRNVVHDGSIPPPWMSQNVSDRIRFRNRERQGIPVNEVKLAELRENHGITFPSPVGTLKVLADPESAMLLVAAGLNISCFYAISTGAAKAFHRLYGFDELKISLMFLPIGGGSLLSAFTSGKLIDWNYRRHARRLDFPMQKNRQTDLSNFPIEKARMEIALPLLLGGAASTIGYGWLMNQKVSLAGPIIMLFILGYCLIAASQALNVLMVDIYPGKPATATAANNVVRCLLGAGATAAIGPLADAVGNGWAYTILALLFVLSSAGPVATMRSGIKWRRAKKEKAERKERAKVVKAEQNEQQAR